MFILVRFGEITKVAQMFGLLFSTLKVRNYFSTKNGWATFWAICSRSHHLVTLLSPSRLFCTLRWKSASDLLQKKTSLAIFVKIIQRPKFSKKIFLE
jgi:hypothetical protein